MPSTKPVEFGQSLKSQVGSFLCLCTRSPETEFPMEITASHREEHEGPRGVLDFPCLVCVLLGAESFQTFVEFRYISK